MTILGQGGDGIDEVQDEGTALAFAHALNFAGAGVTVTLDTPNDRLLVTIPAGGVTDHGALTGLGDDDHPQYLLLTAPNWIDLTDGGATTLHSHAGGGVTDHGLLTGLGDDDHPQYGALAQAETWAALQTFSAGLKLAAAQQIQDSGGTGRILLATASPHLTVTGRSQFDESVGVLANPTATRSLSVGAPTAETGTITMIYATGQIFYGAIGGTYRGLLVNTTSTIPSAGTGHILRAMDFTASIAGGGTSSVVTEVTVARIALTVSMANATATLSLLQGVHIIRPITIVEVGTITLTRGFYIENLKPATGTSTDIYGLLIDDTTGFGGFGRAMEIAGTPGTTPNLRLEYTAPTVSGDSRLLLAFYDGAVVGLRRVVMGAANSGGAGFRQLLVAN